MEWEEGFSLENLILFVLNHVNILLSSEDCEWRESSFTFYFCPDFIFSSLLIFTISVYLFHQLNIYINIHAPNHITRGHLGTVQHDRGGRGRSQKQCV